MTKTGIDPFISKRIMFALLLSAATAGLVLLPGRSHCQEEAITRDEVLDGLRAFYQKTAQPDGSFTPGIDPTYLGMSDCAYSDLAAVTYAVTVHKTLGWKLPHEKKTIEFLLGRQKATGEFFNIKGTVEPKSAQAKTYNTTQGLVALRALGVKPRYNPLPVFEEILKQDYKTLPPYSTSFFPLAYLCYGRPIPKKADLAIRELMVQDETGYLNNHIAATFHASHYYRLIGEETPKSHEMVARVLRDQKPDGSWLLHMPSRDRHATFDAVFVLVQEGQGREDCQKAIAKAAQWALSCRNPDGGFGHFPGSTSDADAVYFHVGTLIMAGFLKPADPLPKDGRLLSWGHLMPVPKVKSGPKKHAFHMGDWVGALAFSPNGEQLAAGSADANACLWDLKTRKKLVTLEGHSNAIVGIAFSPDGSALATASYDRTVRIWNSRNGKAQSVLKGHAGPVMSVAFHPNGKLLATGSIDRSIKLWNVADGTCRKALTGHKSWVNSIAFSPDGKYLLSGNSDGTLIAWDVDTGKRIKTLHATNAEVRSVAWSPDGKTVAAGIRYGRIKTWKTSDWKLNLDFQGHRGDVWSVVFSPDGKQLITGDGDWNRPGPIKFWDVASGKQCGEIKHTGEVLALAVSPQGTVVAAGGGDKMVRVWDIAEARK